jgi:hypothetical protein
MWVQVMYPTPLATNLLQSKTLERREPARCRLACRGVQGGGPSDEDCSLSELGTGNSELLDAERRGLARTALAAILDHP